MAITTTYATLVSAIANWTHRTDWTSYIDEFINITESKMNRKLGLSEMQTRATTIANAEYVSLPTDFLEVRNIQININPVTPLEYRTAHQLDMMNSGLPAYTLTLRPGQRVRKAVIPAAGFGTRLRPYSLIRPKPLFPVLNRPLLLVLLEMLQSAGASRWWSTTII